MLRSRSIAGTHRHTPSWCSGVHPCPSPPIVTLSPTDFALLTDDTRPMSQALACPELCLHYRVLIACINVYCEWRTCKFSSPQDLYMDSISNPHLYVHLLFCVDMWVRYWNWSLKCWACRISSERPFRMETWRPATESAASLLHWEKIRQGGVFLAST